MYIYFYIYIYIYILDALEIRLLVCCVRKIRCNLNKIQRVIVITITRKL